MNGAQIAQPNLIAIFWRAKLRLALNYLRAIRGHVLVHVVVGLSVILFLFVGGLSLFGYVFSWLTAPDQQPFGEPLMRRLVGMVLLAFSSMLVFSNLIIMLTTTYLSREVEFYMAQPISHRRLFFCKMAESTLYSSWAFIILSLPFFIALGRTSTASAPLLYYPVTAVMLIPYIVIPSALGALGSLVVSAFFPAKKMLKQALVLVLMAMVLALASGRYSVISQRWGGGARAEIARTMSFMGVGDIAWAPSTWLARGLRASLAGQWSEALFWSATLIAAALMALQLCYWLSGVIYYKGYCVSLTSGSSTRTRQGGIHAFFDRLVRPLHPPIRALVVKDLTVFWREPAQWGQLVVLFGLLFIYIVNLGTSAELSRLQDMPLWKVLVSLFNVGATSFVLSILSTRFFYPMLSLEGRQQWVIGLAPLVRTRLVWVKYGVCLVSSLAMTIPLMLLSCYMLKAGGFVIAVSLVTIGVMSMGLSSLAIGLGALMPNFREDNPARVANGLGGTLNVILSLIYIGLSIVLEAPLLWAHVNQGMPPGLRGSLLLYGSGALWVAVHLLFIITPMRLGLRNWRRLEF